MGHKKTVSNIDQVCADFLNLPYELSLVKTLQ